MEVMNMRIYVDVNAVRNGNGTEQTPFRKINDAAKIAQPGDEVLVFPGYKYIVHRFSRYRIIRYFPPQHRWHIPYWTVRPGTFLPGIKMSA